MTTKQKHSYIDITMTTKQRHSYIDITITTKQKHSYIDITITTKQRHSYIDITMKLFQNQYNRLDMHSNQVSHPGQFTKFKVYRWLYLLFFLVIHHDHGLV